MFLTRNKNSKDFSLQFRFLFVLVRWICAIQRFGANTYSEINEALCSSCTLKPEKFQIAQEGDIAASALIAWTAIFTSFVQG